MKTIHQIICRSLLLFAFLCTGTNVGAQDADFPNRDISLQILNKRGRPVSNIVANSQKTNEAGMTDRSGLVTFRNMSDSDTVIVNLPKYGKTFIPVAGMEHIAIALRSSVRYSYVDNSGQNVMITKDRMGTATKLDVQAMLQRRTYSSLAELLKGQVPGLIVATDRGSASARFGGPSSLNSSNEALVVIDGMVIGTLNDANQRVNVYDIKTIETVRDGAGWGVRGANGVIIVNTR